MASHAAAVLLAHIRAAKGNAALAAGNDWTTDNDAAQAFIDAVD